MPHIYAQVTIPHRSLIRADDVMNTFHFTGIDDVEDMCTAIAERLLAFYNAPPPGGTNELKDYLSGELNPTLTRVKMYDWADEEPRVPVFDAALGVTTASPLETANLPGEVALCTSYQATPVSGVAAARRRGRLYIGPLNVGVILGGGSSPSRPSGTFMGDMWRTTKRLCDANTLGAQWVVWSRRNEAAYEIAQGYVDNSFDTQRRRGVETTNRFGWTADA